MRAKSWIIAALAAIGLVVSACDNIAPTAPTDPEEVRVYDINTNIGRMPTLDNPPESRTEEILPAEYDNADIPGYDPAYPTSVIRVSQSLRSDLGVSLDPTSTVIWPGSLIDGGSITDGKYIPVSVKRGPVTLSTSNYNQGLPFARVEEATLSGVRGAIHDILISTNHGAASSTASFQTQDIYSASQFELAMGMSANITAGKTAQAMVSAGFDFNNNTIKTRKLVRFVQSYFSVDIDIPNSPADFFASDVTWDTVKNALKSTTAPVYVASVNYGRAAYYCVESSYSSSEVNTALQAAASVYVWGKGADASMFLESNNATVLRESRITGYIMGGNGAAAAISSMTFDGFIGWLQAGNYSPECPVAPLSYTLRYLKDNSVADVVLSSTYYIRHTEPIPTPTPASPAPSATPATPAPTATPDNNKFFKVLLKESHFDCSTGDSPMEGFDYSIRAYLKNGSGTELSYAFEDRELQDGPYPKAAMMYHYLPSLSAPESALTAGSYITVGLYYGSTSICYESIPVSGLSSSATSFSDSGTFGGPPVTISFSYDVSTSE